MCVCVWLCACMLSSLAFVCVSRTPPSAVAFVEAGVGFSWLFNKSQFCGQHTKLMRFTARTRGRGGLSRRGEREGSWAKRQRLPIARVEEKFISFILKISHSFPVSPTSKGNVSFSFSLSLWEWEASVWACEYRKWIVTPIGRCCRHRVQMDRSQLAGVPSAQSSANFSPPSLPESFFPALPTGGTCLTYTPRPYAKFKLCPTPGLQKCR